MVEQYEDGESEAAVKARVEHHLAQAEGYKVAGNARFKEGDLEAALECYEQTLQALSEGNIDNASMRCAVALNQSLCLLKLGRHQDAEERASAALAANPASGKASFRRGLARLGLGDLAGAVEDLQKAARLEPNDREVRQQLEEAKKRLAEEGAGEQEVAVATAVAGAIGQGEGLYSEKLDLNEGRLATTYKEQKEWVKTITDWKEITDIAFAEDEAKNCISVYLTLPGLQELPPNKICVWMTVTSLEVRIIDLNGSNWSYVAQELWGQIDAEHSTWKVRKDKLSLKLQKRASVRSWDRWEKLRRI